LSKTIGAEFGFKNIIVNDKPIKLQIWDTTGEERFKTITKVYYKGAQAMIFVYDMSNSSQTLEATLEEALSDGVDIPVKYLVGNKSDLERSPDSTTAMSSADQKYGMKYIELSAKNLGNLNYLFEQVAIDCIGKATTE
jgi:small GTP-binding protein